MENHTFFKTHGLLVARILMGFLFLHAGITKLTSEAGIAGPAGMIEGAGLPLPMLLAWLTVIIEIGGGAALILGYQMRKAALVLAAFTALTVVFFHPTLEDPNMKKNLAIVGGLLYMVAFGTGNSWSLEGNETSQKTSEKSADPIPSL